MGRDQDLINASRLGDIERVKKLLHQKTYSSNWSLAQTFRLRVTANVNYQDASGYSPLHFASLNGHKDIVLVLLSNSALTDVSDKQGNRPLHLAAWKGNVEIVTALLTHGPSIAKINQKNQANQTALHFAAQYDNDEVVEVLLRSGADASARTVDDESALDLASQYGRLNSAKLIINHQPLLLIKNDSETFFTPLHLASRNGHLNIVKLLLENGADINRSGKNGTALHEAALFGKIEVVRHLLGRGINPHATDPKGRTALKLVQQLESSSVAREIVQEILIRIQDGDQSSVYDVDSVVNFRLTEPCLRSFLSGYFPTDDCNPTDGHMITPSHVISNNRQSFYGVYDNHIGFLQNKDLHPQPPTGTHTDFDNSPLPRVVEEKFFPTNHNLSSQSQHPTPKTSLRGLLRSHWSRSSLSRGLRRTSSQRSSKSLPRLPSSRSRDVSPREASTSSHHHHPSSHMFPVLPVAPSVAMTTEDLTASTATLCSPPSTAPASPNQPHDDVIVDDQTLMTSSHQSRRQPFVTRRARSLDPHLVALEQRRKWSRDRIFSDERPAKPQRTNMTSSPPPIPPKPRHMIKEVSQQEISKLELVEGMDEDMTSSSTEAQESDDDVISDNATFSPTLAAPSTGSHFTDLPPSPKTAMKMVSDVLQKAVSIDEIASVAPRSKAAMTSSATVVEQLSNKALSEPTLLDQLTKSVEDRKLPPLIPRRTSCDTKPVMRNGGQPSGTRRQSSMTSDNLKEARDYVSKRIESLKRFSLNNGDVIRIDFEPPPLPVAKKRTLLPSSASTTKLLQIDDVTSRDSEEVKRARLVSKENTLLRPLVDKSLLQNITSRANSSFQPVKGEQLRVDDVIISFLNAASLSIERLRDDETDVSSLRSSRNTWDEQLSDRTEDNFLPACARKFRGLIRGANDKQVKEKIENREMTLEASMKNKLVDCQQPAPDHKRRHQLRSDDDSTPLSSSPSSISTNDHHFIPNTPTSLYDNDVREESRKAASPTVKLPDVDTIRDTVTAVRSNHRNQGSNPGSSLSTSSASSDAPTSGDVDIDEEWAQIATILSSVKFEAEGIEEGSTYLKEFEQTFWKIMTGKSKDSIHGWLHHVGLGQYEDVLVGNGFDDAEFLSNGILEEKDLVDMDISNSSHRLQMLDSIKDLPRLPAPTSQTIGDWLESLKLKDQMESLMESTGCQTLTQLLQLHRTNQLTNLIKGKRGHRKRIIASLRLLNALPPIAEQSISKDQKVEDRKSEKQVTSKDPTPSTSSLTSRAVEAEAVTSADFISADIPLIPRKPSPTSVSTRKMSTEMGSTSNLPGVERAIFLASPSGEGINLRPPNQTTQEVSVSSWRHQPGILIKSQCMYQAQYLGSMLIQRLKGHESTVEACAKMKKSTTSMKKMPLITLAISYSGVKFIDFESKHEIAEHDISNISFASQDKDDMTTFAYITHDSRTGKHYCHVFRVSSLDTAYEIILTIGQAFEIAYQLIKKDQQQLPSG